MIDSRALLPHIQAGLWGGGLWLHLQISTAEDLNVSSSSWQHIYPGYSDLVFVWWERDAPYIFIYVCELTNYDQSHFVSEPFCPERQRSKISLQLLWGKLRHEHVIYTSGGL